MKKIVLALAVMCFSQFASAGIIIHKEGGGPSGYEKVKTTEGEGWVRLDCTKPGSDVCKWATAMVVGTGDDAQDVDMDITPFVESLIADGNNTGSYDGPGYTVSWEVTEDGGYTITISE